MRGLLLKALRETWVAVLLFGVAIFFFMAALTAIIPQVQGNLTDFMDQMPFLRPLLASLLGIRVDEKITDALLQAFVWVHPVVLATLWAQAITLATRIPAGEIDRGTIDFLLGLPVTRRQVYLAETINWLVAGVVMILFGLAGHVLLRDVIKPELRPSMQATWMILLNLFCVYAAVGGVSALIASQGERRGRAIGTAFGLVLISFLITFLANFWPIAERFAFLSVLQYYQPASVMRLETMPWRDVIVLLGVALTAWIIGGEIFARRQIRTT